MFVFTGKSNNHYNTSREHFTFYSCMWQKCSLIHRATNNSETELRTNMLVVHAVPRLLSSSVSFDVRQLPSSSCVSVVSSGAITRAASLPDDSPGVSTSVLHASITSDRGENRKCTSSGAFGSQMLPFSRACKQRFFFNLGQYTFDALRVWITWKNSWRLTKTLTNFDKSWKN